jgi:hypothetical protein
LRRLYFFLKIEAFIFTVILILLLSANIPGGSLAQASSWVFPRPSQTLDQKLIKRVFLTIGDSNFHKNNLLYSEKWLV